MMKRYLSLLLSSLLIAGILTGCAPAPVVPTDSQTDSSDSSMDGSSNGSTDTDSDASSSTQVKYETPQEALEASPHLVGLTDQKNSRLIVCDLAVEDWSRDAAVVWEFKDPRARGGAGIKLRNNPLFGGDVVLFCGPEGAGIISYQTKEVLFFTSNVGVNPHSVELLPDGTFLVASTTDDRVSVFAAAKGLTNPVQTLSYPNVHGILWDPEYQVVWMAGRTKLSAFSVSGGADKPHLAPNPGMVYVTADWLHDLAPCYGDPTKLFVTCAKGIYIFDKETEKFSTSFPGSRYTDGRTSVPAMGNFADHVLTMIDTTSKETVSREWCTNVVTVIVPLDQYTFRKITRVGPDDAYYKVRVWNSDYQ